MQAAPQRLERFAGFLKRSECRGAVAAILRKLTTQKMDLVSEHRRLQSLDLGRRRVCLGLRRTWVSNLQRNAGEQQMRQSRFAGERRLIEKLGSARAKPPRLEVAPFVEKKKSLIQIQEPRPDQVLLAREHLASLAEPLQGLHRFPLLSVGDSFVGERFRGFVTQTDLFEHQKAFASHFPRLFAQVQLKKNVREVHVAKSQVVGIARQFTGAS